MTDALLIARPAIHGAVILLVVALGCSSAPPNVNGDGGRRPIPPMADVDWSAVDPARPTDRWELRWAFPTPSIPDSVIAANGRVSRERLPPELRNQLAAIRAPHGFLHGCAPIDCYYYIVAAVDGDIQVYDSLDELRRFLGRVSSPAEAILLVWAHGYYWDLESESSWIRRHDDGWEMAVLDMAALCPIQVDRVRVSVSSRGGVEELERREGVPDDGRGDGIVACV